jgi:tetratricopeptide (TPR) repeat protein
VHTLIIGGSETERHRAARTRACTIDTSIALDAGTLPFTRVAEVIRPPSPLVVSIDDIDRAFPNAQVGGTRLVLTQSTYLVQKWIDALGPDDRIMATADRGGLAAGAPEALQSRGPWRGFEVVDLDDPTRHLTTKGTKDTKENLLPVSIASPAVDQRAGQLVARGYASSDAATRLRLCREATGIAPDFAAGHLALASAYREAQDIRSKDAIDRAAALAPDWEAVHFERGKLWLALDDMPRARDAFARAGELMPTFSAAFSNLGATLGELDDPHAALAAFQRALSHDPDSPTILNNVGVVSRELGRFEESEAALRRVTALAPDFVFGHYNFGHTLFLAGNYRAALDAYEEGRRRDPEKNRRQGCRLAMLRLATDDAAGAERDLWGAANGAPPEEREDLLLEACAIGHALLEQHPGLARHRSFVDRIGAEITKSE